MCSKVKEHTRVVRMDKKRLKISLDASNAVKNTFLETNKFIDSTLKEECEKERMTAGKVIFFASKFVKKISLLNIKIIKKAAEIIKQYEYY